MVEVCVKREKNKAISFKRHLEKTHPSTRGHIEIEEKRRRKRGAKKFSNINQVKALTKSSPNFPKNAADFTKPI